VQQLLAPGEDEKSKEMKTPLPASPARKQRQRGNAVLESALVLLTLLTSILFVTDVGRLMLFQQFYEERARTGVRSAIVNNWTNSQLQNFIVYGTTTAGTGTGFLGLNTGNVAVTTLGTDGSSTYTLKVTISGIQMFAWFPMASSYTAAPVVAIMPYQSQGVTAQ